MDQPHITATAVEKLKLAAKSHRNTSGFPLAAALDHVAAQAGYSNWKRVTELAAKPPLIDTNLLPIKHRHLCTWVVPKGSMQLKQVHTVSELCEALGAATPIFIRHACEIATPDNPCFCQLDPFATAMLAGVALDIGDKYDFWNYLFDASKPAREYPAWQKRVVVGLGTSDHYPNEHLTTRDNDDRSDTLNPNNSAHKAATNNRSSQMNPNNTRYQGHEGD
ncbi:hypothetical protein [Pseudomonas marginalis]|jgi:hypothetical protein|uniref:hypothetical protein n=1 Tax=Pseudomonas marginalis TaxID=298 RepID=UPI0011B5643B|nr:hypothetical protein [Pseudomonas marginalis]KAA8554671.1 hypothetical protein FX984_01284 [Pseudomonas marginalis]TWR69620.1 hypothetical protein FIV40_17855 [Pseudomonas marginalis]